jgi:hypothetical protein
MGKKKETPNAKNPCWEGYEMRGMKVKKGRLVLNCIKVKESNNLKFKIENLELNQWHPLNSNSVSFFRSSA